LKNDFGNRWHRLFTGTYIDKKCPFTGNVSIRGRILSGTCHSAKMVRTIIVRRNYLHFVKKYQRHEHNFLYTMVSHLQNPVLQIRSNRLAINLYLQTKVFLMHNLKLTYWICGPLFHSQFLYINYIIHLSGLLFRYEKRHSNIPAHISPCFRVKEGDYVTVGQCRLKLLTADPILSPFKMIPLVSCVPFFQFSGQLYLL